MARAHWLVKSEPASYGWDRLVKDGRTVWDGVRNALARRNLDSMRPGDLVLYYHSNVGKEVVGIMEVIALAHADKTDDTGKWMCVDMRAVEPMPKPVTLLDVKANPKLAQMALVKTSRLSVQPVTAAEWAEVCRMGGLKRAKKSK